MARGYYGDYFPRCRCCRSGPKDTFWCRDCDHVCKAPERGTPHCPLCRNPMLNMGEKWRPGKKGHRTIIGSRLAYVAVSPHERLARKLLKQWTP